ncbi:MAG: hypothetical protein ACP5LC_01600 [Thermoplasmata archaeon]
MKLNYDNILKEVKRIVRKYIKNDRPVGLAISYFDPRVGAYWVSGGNYIVLNGNIISAMDAWGRTQNEKEALVKVLLTHEYIHSLGYEDEMITRKITSKIIEKEDGKESLEYELSDKGPWEIFPFIVSYPYHSDQRIEIVGNFDSESTDYIM